MEEKKKGRLVLKGRALLEKSGLDNVHQVSLEARLSAQTAYKYLQTPENVSSLDLRVLLSILRDGLKLTDRQILDMKVSDLFEIAHDE
jgi:hypothetical protein